MLIPVLGAPYGDPGGRVDAGETYVVFGSATPQEIALATLVADGKGIQINGVSPDDYSGWSVSGAGDVNQDGLADVVLGAWSANPRAV